jgi:serum/glucocorticoid-regulated kinase 2
MILDYCPGGELFNLQRKVIRFDEESAKKYFIEVLLAIDYLHSKEIIYRDLKPENIMLDIKGHIKIADFGLAKKTKEKRYSFCGSLEYMSPEVLARRGHSFEVDYYCMGALLFEMLVGCPPFY